jgi:phosphatidylserine/phosphatidylglycerophosphate/cardiolipin synthase-like enzyme
MRRLYAVVLLVTVACRGMTVAGDDTATPDSGVTHDGPDNSGCSATKPRTDPPEAFVGPQGLQPRLDALIDSATQTLDVQMYLFTVDELADRIIAAKQRGVAVRVILDVDHPGNEGTRSQLLAAGVPTRNSPSIYSFSHAKYLLIDREVAVIMSMNFNVDAMDSERNYGIVDRDLQDVTDVGAIFDMDWAAGGGEAPKPADLSCTRLIVSPNNSKQRVLELIDGATKKLDVEALYVSENGVRDAIVAAKQRGVAVRAILEGSMDSAGTIPFFQAAGIPVHDAAGFFLHAKLLVADGVAFVGSENYSQTSLTRNREVGALVFEPAPAQLIQQQFDADFASTPVSP